MDFRTFQGHRIAADWRDRTGHEVDALLDFGTRLTAIEVKAGRTISSDYFKGLKYFSALKGISLVVPYR